jgi:hypothetical protein
LGEQEWCSEIQIASKGTSEITELLPQLAYEGGTVRVWNVNLNEDLQQYSRLGKYLVHFPTQSRTKSSYENTFGPPQNMRTVKEMVGFNRDIPIESQVWEVRCSDARITVRGGWGGIYGDDNIGPVLVFQFDKYVDGICPSESELVKDGHPKKREK